MNVAGVDPGEDGAVVLLAPDGSIIHVLDMPTVTVTVGKTARKRVDGAGLAHELRGFGPMSVVIEAVGGRPTDHPVFAFNFGRAAGIAEGVVATLGLPMTFVHPVAWRRSMGVNLPAGSKPAERKEASRQRALQLWPQHAETFRRKLDSDRAEAALLARWGLLCAALGGIPNAA